MNNKKEDLGFEKKSSSICKKTATEMNAYIDLDRILDTYDMKDIMKMITSKCSELNRKYGADFYISGRMQNNEWIPRRNSKRGVIELVSFFAPMQSYSSEIEVWKKVIRGTLEYVLKTTSLPAPTNMNYGYTCMDILFRDIDMEVMSVTIPSIKQKDVI